MSTQKTGVAEYTSRFLDSLLRQNTENQYFLFYNSQNLENKKIEKWQGENIHYIKTDFPNKLFNLGIFLFGFPKLDKLIESKIKKDLAEPDFKLDSFISPNLNYTEVSKSVKYVLVIHDLSFELFPDTYSAKRRLWHKIVFPKKQCQRADLILTPSENTRQDLIKYFKLDQNKIKVSYPNHLFGSESSVGFEKLKEKYQLPEKYILYLGTLEPRKNLEALLTAFSKTKARDGGFKLVIAGSKGWKYKKILEEIKKTDGVKYIGYVDDEDKDGLYKNSKLFVYPSLYEGFGLPVLEAMSSGVAVITSNRSSLVEVGGNAVHYINPLNISDMIIAIDEVLENSELNQELVNRGYERVEKFNTEVRLLELLSR